MSSVAFNFDRSDALRGGLTSAKVLVNSDQDKTSPSLRDGKSAERQRRGQVVLKYDIVDLMIHNYMFLDGFRECAT